MNTNTVLRRFAPFGTKASLSSNEGAGSGWRAGLCKKVLCSQGLTSSCKSHGSRATGAKIWSALSSHWLEVRVMRTLQDRATVGDLPPSDAEVLIQEARRRQRRRRAIIGVVVLLVGGLLVGVLSVDGGSPPPSGGDQGERSQGQPSAKAASATHVSRVEISVISPQSYTTGTLGASGGHVFIGSIFGTRCQLTTVLATTLRVLSNRSVSCNDPLLYGQDVMPVESVEPVHHGQYGDVRIAVRNPATGSVHLGRRAPVRELLRGPA